jgi:hypothetical protein
MTVPKMTPKERRFLALMYPTGTVMIGLKIGEALYSRGFIKVATFGRYGITPEGARAIEHYPESLMTVGPDR